MTAPENNESQSDSTSVVLMDVLKRAHAHVVDAVRADENEYLESAVRSYALAMDYFKTYLKMSEIEKKKYGTRDERQQLVGKIVQYQKRLQKLRRDLMRKKYDEKDEEEKTTTTTTTTTTKERKENNENNIEEEEEEKTTAVVVQLTNATTATENEKKERDDALHLETIIEDEELRTLVENSDDREENHASGGGDVGSMNSSGSSNSSGKKTTKTLTFDRSLSAMPRLMKTVSVGGSGDAKEDGDDGKRRGGVFDWLLDALDTLDDKIAEKVERAEDAIFDAFEDVQESFKKNFSFRKNTTTDAKENKGKNDGAATDANESRVETTTTPTAAAV